MITVQTNADPGPTEEDYRYAQHLAWRFWNHNDALGFRLDKEDCMQEAALALTEAHQSYTPGRAAFRTFAYTVIHRRLRHWRAKQSSLIAMDSTSEHLMYPLVRLRSSLRASGEVATHEALAALTGRPVTDVVRALTPPTIVSIDGSQKPQDDDTADYRAQIAGEDSNWERPWSAIDARGALPFLSDEQFACLCLRYMEGCTVAQIAQELATDTPHVMARLATARQAVADRYGREALARVMASKTAARSSPSGLKGRPAALTSDEEQELRRLAAQGRTITSLAEEFQVHRNTASRIVNG